MHLIRLSAFCMFLLSWACQPKLPSEVEEVYVELPDHLDYNIHVKPILSDKCFACHGPDKAAQKAGLSLHLPNLAFAKLPDSPGKVAIKPGSLRGSEVFYRILSEDEEYRMPSVESNLSLSPREKAILIKWIQEGAEYKKHWAFIPPAKISPPEVDQSSWVQNPIDQFVLKKLETKHIRPTGEADKATLLRRLSLDLTGLPPSPEEVQAFLSDDSDQAYEKQVDRLLASPHYGEKMAQQWMDIARYADTHGYTVDRYRDASPYRDWVIGAFNKNLSYDQFIVEQLAGDLLPSPTKDQLIATAFNRIHPQNMEGGIVEEEFRVEYVIDRTSTMGQAFMAMTLGCARCHDHKYDPITQKNFFELSSFFNQVDEAGQISWDNATPVPTMLLTDDKKDQIIDYLRSLSLREASRLGDIGAAEKEEFERWMASGAYQKELQKTVPPGRIAYYTFDQQKIQNQLPPKEVGVMESNEVKNQKPEYVEGFKGKSVRLNGDSWLDLRGPGVFGRDQPFSIVLWVNIPKAITNGVIFHKSQGAILYNRRGYQLGLEDNRLELLLAHTAPYNAVRKVTLSDIPRDQWIQLAMTYDGSSDAQGLHVFVNGKAMETSTTHNNLYKDILFQRKDEPSLQVGAIWRGKGIKGGQVDEISVFDRQLTELELLWLNQPDVFQQLIAKTPADLDDHDKALLWPYFLQNQSSAYQQGLQKLQHVRKALTDTVETIPEMMIMQEMAERRPTYLLERGVYSMHGEEVFPNTPDSILPFPEDLPKNRLGLAQWLIAPEHPLTARVAVNRFWQYFFGKGLVESSGDFGNQGNLPSHPELLDWLAKNFQDSGWDVKATLKLILTSATYRQSSLLRPELAERDPENVWLARGPSQRLSAEQIRDQALAAAGMLNLKIGGQSVYPYQPEGLWEVNGASYQQGTGEDLYRRSMYTIWKRSVLHPDLSIFDAPDHSYLVSKRQETNTPLQALALLNDPTFVEAAKVLGEEMSRKNGPEGIDQAFLKLTGRKPLAREKEVLMALQSHEYKKFQQHPDKLKGWLEIGEYKPDPMLEAAQVAANTVVASTIMNSDAFLTKR